MRSCLKYPVFIILLALHFSVRASHIAGGGFTYRYVGDTVVFGTHMLNYEVTLWLYQDCTSGDAGAVAQDNPAYFTIYENGTNAFFKRDTSVFYNPAPGAGGNIQIPVMVANSPCHSGTMDGAPETCLLRKKFTRRYALPPNASGYKVVYQRCCLTSQVSNVVNPRDFGVTLFCDIPGGPVTNTTAQFQFAPHQIVCVGNALDVDLSASDADGDSLTYEFGAPYIGASDDDIKPIVASPPPYESVQYFPPYTAQEPLSAYPALAIDRFTGHVTGTPNKIGAYLIKVLCHEWRNGQLINTASHEFQWLVADCQGITNTLVPHAGGDRTVLVGEKVQFHVTGGDRYYWVPGTFLDNAFIADPVGTFTKPGEYVYRISAVDDSGCTGTTEVKVSVLEHSDVTAPNAFTPNGDGLNDVLMPLAVKGSYIKSFRVYNRWGVEVFRAMGPGTGWNGEYNGTPQPAAVYAWMAEFTDTNGQPHTKAGTTILLR